MSKARIIAGSAKNVKLEVVSGLTRPITDRGKTVVFDLISEFISTAKVLDLFAGSGSYGLEALSRGAIKATFIDSEIEACKVITANIKACKFDSVTEVINAKLPKALSQLKIIYDLVFCDPPFTNLEYFKLKDYAKLITTNNLFILRLPLEHKVSFTKLGLKLIYKQIIGISVIYFIRADASLQIPT